MRFQRKKQGLNCGCSRVDLEILFETVLGISLAGNLGWSLELIKPVLIVHFEYRSLTASFNGTGFSKNERSAKISMP